VLVLDGAGGQAEVLERVVGVVVPVDGDSGAMIRVSAGEGLGERALDDLVAAEVDVAEYGGR